MKKPVISALLLILSTLLCYSQPDTLEHDLHALFKADNGNWGVINIKGEIVIKAEHEHLKHPKDGMAGFRLDGNWGFINMDSEVVVPADYEFISYYNGGVAGVSIKKEVYVIDKEGNKTEIKRIGGKKELPKKMKIRGIETFENGLAMLRVDEWNGRNMKEKFGYINDKAEIVVIPEHPKMGRYHEGIAWFVTERGNWGFINENGDVILEPNFLFCSNSSEGLAWVKTRKKSKKGYIDKTGKFAIEPIYKKAGDFHAGLAWVKIESLIGFINKTGEIIIEPKYKEAGNFDPASGLAKVITIDKKGKNYVNMNGELISFENSQLHNDFVNGLCIEKSNGLFGYLNKKGEWEIKPAFEKVTKFKYGYARVSQDNKWGVINRKGEWVIEPKYKMIREFWK
jgi:hypothetical protein